MTKSELIAILAGRFQRLTVSDAELSANLIIIAMAHALVQGGRVEIRGFGSFQTHRRPARAGRNPRTGQAVAVPSKTVVHFKAGKAMRERVGASAPVAAATS